MCSFHFTVTVLLPIGHSLFIGDSSGSVRKIYMHRITEEIYWCEKLCGKHNSKVDFLFSLNGAAISHGFLSGSDVSKDEKTKRNSLYYMKGLENVPCTLLISAGVGYQELFTSNTNEDTCFITWALPCAKV